MIQLAKQSATRLAWSGGIGIGYAMDTGVLFVDMRYHRIETSEPTEFIPLRIGYRF